MINFQVKQRKPKRTDQSNTEIGNNEAQDSINNGDIATDAIFSDISFESENDEDNVLVVNVPNEPLEDIEIEIENLKVK